MCLRLKYPIITSFNEHTRMFHSVVIAQFALVPCFHTCCSTTFRGIVKYSNTATLQPRVIYSGACDVIATYSMWLLLRSEYILDRWLTQWHPCVCFTDYPGAVYPLIPVPASPATRLRCRLPSGRVRLEEKMSLFLPAAPPRHHDSESGSHCLDHKGHEFLSGECSKISRNEAQSFVQVTLWIWTFSCY